MSIRRTMESAKDNNFCKVGHNGWENPAPREIVYSETYIAYNVLDFVLFA